MRTLPVHLVHKVWGRHTPPAPFTNPGKEPLGEIWFDPPPELDSLLVKFIFTDAALSVQVHPDDAQAPAGQRGKNECWYILDAQPGATIAVGLERAMSVDELRAGALDGSIESAVRRLEVQPGDFVSIPAGTIHAIGPGISLLEVQQNSDVTYRLYDYGRPRDLHLEEALRVVRRQPFDDALLTRAGETSGVYCELIDGPFFRVAKLTGSAALPNERFGRECLVLPLSEGVTLDEQPLSVGSCTIARGLRGLALRPDASAILVEETHRANA